MHGKKAFLFLLNQIIRDFEGPYCIFAKKALHGFCRIYLDAIFFPVFTDKSGVYCIVQYYKKIIVRVCALKKCPKTEF